MAVKSHITVVGSHAGLMWAGLAQRKGVTRGWWAEGPRFESASALRDLHLDNAGTIQAIFAIRNANSKTCQYLKGMVCTRFVILLYLKTG